MVFGARGRVGAAWGAGARTSMRLMVISMVWLLGCWVVWLLGLRGCWVAGLRGFGVAWAVMSVLRCGARTSRAGAPSVSAGECDGRGSGDGARVSRWLCGCSTKRV